MKRLLHAALSALLLAPAGRAGVARLEITIAPQFQGEPLKLDSLRYRNAAGETLSVSRFSCLLSGFALQRDSGEWLEFPAVHAWLDASARRQTVELDSVPPAPYRAVRFHVGPDAAVNAADPAVFPAAHALNPAVNGLHWSWQGGYVFMALEGHFRQGAGEPQGYVWHLARNPNRSAISLTAALDLRHDAGLLVHFDVAALLNAPRALSFADDGSVTHSREGDPVAAALRAALPGAFRVYRIASAAPAAPAGPPVHPIDLPDKFTPYPLTMSRTFPMPDLPRDNPLISERVALGKRLFYDPMLSRDGSISCASCHAEQSAFTDGRRVSTGIAGRQGDRNTMPLFNLAWKSRFFWTAARKPSAPRC